jgi:hypothetical protein
MSYFHGSGATLKLTTRNFDNLGHGMPSRTRWRAERSRAAPSLTKVEFSQSLAAIAVLEQWGALQENAAFDNELRVMAPGVKLNQIIATCVSSPRKKVSL